MLAPVVGVMFVFLGCSTVMTSQKTETMGTEQLLWYLESDQDFGKKWVAETLGQRLLTNEQIDLFVAAIESDSPAHVREQIVYSLAQVLEKRDDAQLDRHVRATLLEMTPRMSNDKVCLRALTYAVALSPDVKESTEYAIQYMQENRHGRVRYWCLQFVIANGLEEGSGREATLAAIHRTLAHESNAAVAELACRELGRYIYTPALPTMEDISNTGNVRKFESASFDSREGRKTQADVLTAAIRYAEGIRFATGDL